MSGAVLALGVALTGCPSRYLGGRFRAAVSVAAGPAA